MLKLTLYTILGLWMAMPLGLAQYKLEKLNEKINTEYDEISPIVTEDGTLYFTRMGSPDFQKTLIQHEEDLSTTLSREEYADLLNEVYSQIANKKIKKAANSQFNQDVWLAHPDQGRYRKIEHPGFPLNNALPNSVVAYSFKDKALILINQFGRDGSLYHGFSKTKREGLGNFEFPEPIYIYDFYSQRSEVSATMSHDADVIILALERTDGLGNLDLYVSFKIKENLWSTPTHLGPEINSEFREITPFISRDKKRLFFASDRTGSEGGLDIYVSRRLDVHWTKWTKPRKLFFPINSDQDDTQPFYDEVRNFFYFTSNRDGSSDIFRVNLDPEANQRPLASVMGEIRDKHTKELLSAEVSYRTEGPYSKSSFYRTQSGKFQIELDLSYPITFFPSCRGYLCEPVELNPKNVKVSEDQAIHFVIELEPLSNVAPSAIIASNQSVILPTQQTVDEKPAKPAPVKEVDKKPHEEETVKVIKPKTRETITLGKILFVQSKSQLLKSSYPELNKLVKMMNENESLEILVEGHTDSVGEEVALKMLSSQRAQGIKEYLVYKGIEADRIQTKGLGASRPLNDNTTELKRQANRRVEVVVLKS